MAGKVKVTETRPSGWPTDVAEVECRGTAVWTALVDEPSDEVSKAVMPTVKKLPLTVTTAKESANCVPEASSLEGACPEC